MDQILPRAGEKREALRQKGQFWTPGWVADAMVAYVLREGARHIFDPAMGEGAFWRAAKRLESRVGRRIVLRGTEMDAHLIEHRLPSGFSAAEIKGISHRDFVQDPPDEQFDAIVANPPYIRHHRLAPDYKAQLKAFVKSLGCNIDGRAGLHFYFLLRALLLLRRNGRLAFIVPADTFEGISSPALWEWITTRYRVETVVTFTPKATPFPGVDTNAVIVGIKNAPPTETYLWAQCSEPNSPSLFTWLAGESNGNSLPALDAESRPIKEWLSRGLSRQAIQAKEDMIPLGNLVRVMRGIATGANDYFFLTETQVRDIRIPEEFLTRAVGRTRDVETAVFDAKALQHLNTSERPTYLFSPDGRPMDKFPAPVRKYLKQGEERQLPSGALISTRKPWYKMEFREPPPFLFSYLGRRNVRFIRNLAGIVPLTSFLCIYPKDNTAQHIEQLWNLLSHPEILDRLGVVGKSYGGGAIKVEPRSLEKLPVPVRLLNGVGLSA